MKALILAAGYGGRLGSPTEDKPKALVQVLGMSLIERVILTAKKAGINEFLVVCGYLGEKLKSDLGNGERFGVKIDFMDNEDWQMGNGTSALIARDFLEEKFILLMADHIFNNRILSELIKHDVASSIVVAVDRKEPSKEDTKLLEKGGRVIDIGKDIEESNCIDTGMFLCSPKIFFYIEEAVKEVKTELTDGIAKAVENRDVEIFDITQIDPYIPSMRKEPKPFWMDIDTVRLQTNGTDVAII